MEGWREPNVKLPSGQLPQNKQTSPNLPVQASTFVVQLTFVGLTLPKDCR